ncbi:Transcriptional regulator [Mycetohabitans rhizoxinica HKI 454]|uniref:Transcriptional regulator n=1 Tax=Mycetohabitans rhizoxinica (strain DSM 19002 / CIP 109453 / HKI 454) TaxID=882378 RepID=E5ANZ4_MYCRK|nr:Transcriptional regulator [Mycetohabitans rhizoxinica HKI 454]
MPHALIVEDDPNSLSGLSAILSTDGFSVDTAATLVEARAALQRFIPDVVLVDLNLPDGSGLDVLHSLPSQPDGATPVIVMTGNATVESAIEGLRHGIWDYLLKPVNIPRLRSLLARIPRPYELTEEVQNLRAALRRVGRFGSMIGRGAAMQQVYDTIERIAPTEAAVLIVGEPGTGKEIAARTLHEMSRRKKSPLVKLDGAAASHAGAEPWESMLFGHQRGAFDGAETNEAGVLERAAGGTLFIDRVDLLPAAQQEALARALGVRTFRRMGGTTDLKRRLPGGGGHRRIAAAGAGPRHAARRPAATAERGAVDIAAAARARRGHRTVGHLFRRRAEPTPRVGQAAQPALRARAVPIRVAGQRA